MADMSERERRRLSSDGQTEKPPSKMLKMAGGKEESNVKDFETKIIDQMTVIADAVSSLQKGQKELRSSFDSKLDKFRNEFMASIDDKFKAMKLDFDLELGRHQGQIDSLSRSVDTLIERIQKVENLERPEYEQESASGTNKKNQANTLYDPELTIIANNVRQCEDENIFEIANDMISHLSDSVKVVAAARLKSRGIGKPGLVKISFRSVDEKIEVLRSKRDLQNVEAYKSVFLRSSKSHTERLIELNAKTILNQIPNGNQFRITSNGRIVKKTQNSQQNSSPDFHDQDRENH